MKAYCKEGHHIVGSESDCKIFEALHKPVMSNQGYDDENLSNLSNDYGDIVDNKVDIFKEKITT